jgi:hypothetical protein
VIVAALASAAPHISGGSIDLPFVTWTQPLYGKESIRIAGETLIADVTSAEDRELARAITNNWRSSHAFPLNTLQINLKRVARDFDEDPTVAQRIKRLSSIVSKLERLRWLKLDEMQDLGGCRAVLSSVDTVAQVSHFYRQESSIRHKLQREDDYITKPKRSGYRGVHLIYSYVSDKKQTYAGMQIEMQIRSRLQHAWATAVETVGTFTSQALKSSAGERDWLRFFALMSSELAWRESTTIVPNTPDNAGERSRELRNLAAKLRVIERLQTYGTALRVIEVSATGASSRKGTYLVMELDTGESLLRWSPFTNPAAAADAYNALEAATADVPERDVVLVRVESLEALRRAYPNYFADTTVFAGAVREAIEG